MKTQSAIKTATLALALICGWSFHAMAQSSQCVTLYSTSDPNGVNFALQTNQIVSVIGYDWANQPNISGSFPDGTGISLIPFNTLYFTAYQATYSSAAASIGSQIPQTITGITNLNVTRQPYHFVLPANTYLGGNPGWATFQITTPTTANVISNYVPADAIVIPASATGNVQIILESSPDLVNWTAANPGTYGASAGTNRFFRVRAAAN